MMEAYTVCSTRCFGGAPSLQVSSWSSVLAVQSDDMRSSVRSSFV